MGVSKVSDAAVLLVTDRGQRLASPGIQKAELVALWARFSNQSSVAGQLLEEVVQTVESFICRKTLCVCLDMALKR